MDGGTVIISDREYKKISPRKIAQMGITRTFQHVRLFEQMTVLDNILVVLTERGVTASLFEKHTKEHITQAKRVLKRVDLWDKRNDLANNLSYGQRKLLEIARTLAMDAKMYLFDEPFAGLFPQMRKIVISIIQELRDAHHAVVLIEHSMELIRQLSDYVYVMDAGKLLAEGTAEEVLSSKHVIEAYLGE